MYTYSSPGVVDGRLGVGVPSSANSSEKIQARPKNLLPIIIADKRNILFLRSVIVQLGDTLDSEQPPAGHFNKELPGFL